MYQRYRGGNMDEGWIRFVLEQFRFPYTTLMDAEIRKGSLHDKYDVIILPDDTTGALMGDPAPPASGRAAAPRPEPPPIPPEYRSGLGDDGAAALKSFVEQGGTLVTFGGAANFAIEKIGLGVRNVVANLNSKEFWCPGSTLRAAFDVDHSLAYGMPGGGLVVYFTGNPVFEISSTQKAEQYEVFARYAPRDLLESGWLVGEAHLAGKAAAVAAKHGQGRVILLGFRPQHRAQTHATFKLVFNALL
jgi:hypothetical protein